MIKSIILSFLFWLHVSQLVAQDVHLSQFFASDHLLNPANVGDHSGDFRACLNYRSQWKSIENAPLTTFIGSFDKKFHYYTHEYNVGVMIVSDQFSTFQTNTTKAIFTGSYVYPFKKHLFRGGIQMGVISNSTNLNKQTFPEQWDYPNGEFNSSLPSKEVALRSSQLYLDVNVGGSWKYKFNKFEIKSGIAINHINRPKSTYFSSQVERLRARKVINTEVNYPLNPVFTLCPQFMWMWTTKANDLVFGSRLKYKTNVKLIPELSSGIFYRHGVVRNVDAFIVVVGLKYKKIDFGMSYDLNISSLHTNIKRPSAFEFSLIYTGASSQVKYKIIPCSRY